MTVSNYPYWLTIQGDGTHANAGVASEQIQVYPGQIIQFTTTASFQSSYTNAGGAATLTLTFYTSGNAPISSFLGAFPNTMTGGQQYLASTTSNEVPSNASYAIAYIQQGGTPSSTNLLQVYQAEVDQGGVPVNQNFAFAFTYYPWSAFGTGAQINWAFSPLIANDFDSLVIDGLMETMGGPGGVPCPLPNLLDANGVGPRYRILAPPSMNTTAYGYEPSYDLNAPQPTQDVVASMLLDGERPFGTRASNRTISLPVIIFGTQAGGMAQVLAAMEFLMQTIDQQVFPLKWTPADTGLPMIFDCFRAMPSTPVYGFNYSAGGSATGSAVGRPNCPIGMITLTIQAMPYGRSDVDGVQELTFTNPLVGGNPGGSGVVVDNFTAVNGPTLIGSHSATGSSTTSVIPVTVSTSTQSGIVVSMTCPNSTAQTVSGVDSKGNTYSVIGQEQLASSPAVSLFLLDTQQNAVPLVAGTDTITITTTNSQPMTSQAYSIASLQAVDTQTVNSGTTAAPSINSGGATQATNPVTLAFFANNSTQIVTSTPAGWIYEGNVSSSALSTDMFWQSDAGTGVVTCTSSYNSSVPVVAVCLTLDVVPGTNWIADTQNIVAAGGSAHYLPPRPMKMPWPAAVYTKTLPATVSIVGLPNLSVWFGQAYDTQWPRDTKFVSNISLAYTLTDSNGKTLSFNTSYKNTSWGETPITPKWTQITAAIPQGRVGFAYNSVQKYSVSISNWSGSGSLGYVRMHAWLNGLTANPQTIANPTSPRGMVYNVFGLVGTARAPISVQAQLPSEASTVVEYTGPTSGNWIVPPNVYTVMAETWGGGGAGSTCFLARQIGGAGGGGAAYSMEPSLSVVPGSKVPYTVGQAGLPAQQIPTVIQFSNPGLSHWTCPLDVTSVKIEMWGGGAAGAAGGGGGGGAQYAAEPNFSNGTYANNLTTTLTPGVTYYIWVAHGGTADTGTSAAARASRLGETSWFGPTSCPGPNHAYVVAYGGVSPLTGGTNGGTGGINSTATTHWAGGAGGSSPGPAGGGGGAAAGPTARGAQGGDSPASSVYGRWQGSGAGGTGATTISSPQTQGGAGGAGASVPGFPVAGYQPGGGGGGGYSGPSLSSNVQPATESLAQATVNFLGANGGAGLVQLTYEVGGGFPVNGGATTFGSIATTAKVVSANGGNSAASNSAVGGLGGAANGTNFASFSGGNGGFYTSGPQGAYMSVPRVNNIFQTLGSAAYITASYTSGTAASSCAQGVGVVLVESAAPVSDLYVSDSAGNVYSNQGGTLQQSSGTAGTSGATLYAFVANLLYPITTATTLTVNSATPQEYGVLWYASPWLIGGITSANVATGHGNGTAVSSTFNTGDGSSIQYELVVALNDGTQAFTQTTYNGRLWYNAASTSTLTASNLVMNAYLGVNEGGANGTNAGDTLAATVGSAANWATIAIPFLAANQAQGVVQMDWRTGTVPGASTTWTNSASIDAQGMIVVVGMCGSGATVTAAPSAVSDASGNHYSKVAGGALPVSGGNIWAYAAPVTAGLAQGVTGSISWGAASATPNYTASVYWLPNVASAVTGIVSGFATGSSTTPSYTQGSVTGSPDMVLLTTFANAVSATVSAGPPVTGGTNQVDQLSQAYLNQTAYATQIVDAASTTLSATYSASHPWGALGLGFQPNTLNADSALGQGGGAAAGPNGPGYPATFSFGAPGYSGGGKGGSGAQSVNNGGGGAAIPGGGGGGAWSNNTSADSGGQGAAGMVRLTWVPPLQPFNTLIVHKPSDGASPNLSPITPIPITDIPNNTEYTVPSLVPGLNAAFNGTYTVILANYSWDSPGNSRQVSVTINQYEYPGGPRSSVQATKALTPATDVVNGVVNLGEVTLPIKDYAAHNDQSYFTIAVNDTNTADRFMDVLLLDTQGETILINIAPGAPGYGTYINYYIDEAQPNVDLGYVGATVQDRQHQVSILDFTSVNGGVLYVTPGDNMIMTWSPSGAPNLGVFYSPRWFLSRTV